jgi:hypothetical protein
MVAVRGRLCDERAVAADDGFVERMNRTPLDERFRVQGRTK